MWQINSTAPQTISTKMTITLHQHLFKKALAKTEHLNFHEHRIDCRSDWLYCINLVTVSLQYNGRLLISQFLIVANKKNNVLILDFVENHIFKMSAWCKMNTKILNICFNVILQIVSMICCYPCHLQACICGFPIATGAASRLISGYDSYGNTCGQNNTKIEGVPLSGRDMRENKLVWFVTSDIDFYLYEIHLVSFSKYVAPLLSLKYFHLLWFFESVIDLVH